MEIQKDQYYATKLDLLKEVKASADDLVRHEKECEKRYVESKVELGDVKIELAVVKIIGQRTERVIYLVFTLLIGLAIKAIWELSMS